MAQTVRELIRKLKRMPPEGIVGWQDHDHGEDDLNALVRVVEEASPGCKAKYGVDVILRP